MAKHQKEMKWTDEDMSMLDTKASKITYIIFMVLVSLTLFASIVILILNKTARETQIAHILLGSVALILFNVPLFIKKKFRWYIPTVLQVFIIVFIYAHFILGEVQGAYKASAVFDKILHTTSGLAIAAIGFSLVNILNADSSNTHLKLSPFFVALFSFCFALAVAVIWEIIEYFMDSVFGMNMQRYIPPANLAQEVAPRQGYGLIDTMGDIIVSTVAALVVCVTGYISLRTKSNFLNRFLIRKVPDFETALLEAKEAGDEALVHKLQHAIARIEEEKRINQGDDLNGGGCVKKSSDGDRGSDTNEPDNEAVK